MRTEACVFKIVHILVNYNEDNTSTNYFAPNSKDVDNSDDILLVTVGLWRSIRTIWQDEVDSFDFDVVTKVEDLLGLHL